VSYEARQTTTSSSDTVSSVVVEEAPIVSHEASQTSIKPLDRLIDLAKFPGVDMVKWTDETKKAYRREFIRTCKGVFDLDFYTLIDGWNVLHHAVKAGNGLAVINLQKFYTNLVDTDDNAWNEYMSIRDAEGRNVYDNAPNKEFKDWLYELKPVETLFDGYDSAAATQTTVVSGTLFESDLTYYERLFA
jgi:hypothetical protein